MILIGGAAMDDHTITFWTFIFTALGVAVAVGGVFYAIKTLKENSVIAQAQFFATVRQALANYDDVHANVRPTGIWAPRPGEKYAALGPRLGSEWARVELYMGTFEYCEKLLTRGLLDEKDFAGSFRYRLNNLMTNAVIVQEKLHVREKDWQVFLRLCERLQVRIPTREELGQVQP
jgi:hypothetical protein